MATSFDVVMVRRGSLGDSPSPVTIHGLRAWEQLADELRLRGHQFWHDLPASELGGRRLVLLWDFGSVARLPKNLRDRAQGRIVAWSLESPLVAHRAYHRLDRIADESAHLFAFPGAARMVADSPTQIHDFFWPMEDRSVPPTDGWEHRSFLVMINSNKNTQRWVGSLTLRDPYRSLRTLAASALALTYAPRGSWTVPDLYAERLRAIGHFAHQPDFVLHGVGWDDRRIRDLGPYRQGVTRSYRGPVKSKLSTLSGYRFALCFENTVFPGYITEKLLDCLFAGTIPVYLGAPDVDRYIPSDLFVDVRAFSSYSDLEEALRSLSMSEAERHLAAARDFTSSPAFAKFRSDFFITRILDAIEEMIGD